MNVQVAIVQSAPVLFDAEASRQRLTLPFDQYLFRTEQKAVIVRSHRSANSRLRREAIRIHPSIIGNRF